MLTVERLKELLVYDPDTGLFTRRITVNNGKGIRKKAGDIVGYISRRYVIITLDGYKDYAHRWAWLYMTGAWPTSTLDHWDRDKTNNRWKNIRLASQSMNNGNTIKPRTNTSGAKGVSPSCGRGKPWIVHLQDRYLGSFDTVEEAKACYDKAAKELYGEFFCP